MVLFLKQTLGGDTTLKQAASIFEEKIKALKSGVDPRLAKAFLDGFVAATEDDGMQIGQLESALRERRELYESIDVPIQATDLFDPDGVLDDLDVDEDRTVH